MSYIDSICGCCKKRQGMYTCANIYTHARARKIGKREKARSLNANNTNNNNNNKKEAGAFLYSTPSAAVKIGGGL